MEAPGSSTRTIRRAQPVVSSIWSKTPRNRASPCATGKAAGRLETKRSDYWLDLATKNGADWPAHPGVADESGPVFKNLFVRRLHVGVRPEDG